MQPLAAAFAIAQKNHGGALPPAWRLQWSVDRLLAESAAPAGKHSRSPLHAVAATAGVPQSALTQMLAKHRAIQTCQSAFHAANGCAPTPATAALSMRLAFALDYYKRQNGACSKAVVTEALQVTMRTFTARVFQRARLVCTRHVTPELTRFGRMISNADLTGVRNSTTRGQPRYVDSSSADMIVHTITSRSEGTTPVLMSELPGLMQTTGDNKVLPSRSTVARFVRDLKHAEQPVRLRRGKAIAIGRAEAGQRDSVMIDHFQKLGDVYVKFPVRALGH